MDDEKPSDNLMHGIRLRKGKCFSDKSSTRLPQSTIPTFHMISLSTSFTNTFMCLDRENELVGFPKIAVTSATLISWRDLFPKLATGRLTSISDYKGYDLASTSAHDRPNPTFVPFFLDK
jgi:hypothetical protein